MSVFSQDKVDLATEAGRLGRKGPIYKDLQAGFGGLEMYDADAGKTEDPRTLRPRVLGPYFTFILPEWI